MIRIFLSLTFISLSCFSAKAAEYLNLIVPPSLADLETPARSFSPSITLARGDRAEVVWASGNNSFLRLEINVEGHLFLVSIAETTQGRMPIIAGPAVIKLRRDERLLSPLMATVAISRGNEAPSFTPSTAVVIPENEDGIFRVILESSTDLLTWAEASPGTYGSNAAKRFFRTRILKSSDP